MLAVAFAELWPKTAGSETEGQAGRLGSRQQIRLIDGSATVWRVLLIVGDACDC